MGPLAAALRRAEAHHHDLEALVPHVVSQHQLDDVDDVAAVLQYRLDKAASSVPRGCRERPRLVVGLLPEALGSVPAEHRQGLDERKALIERRALNLVMSAADEQAPWIRWLGDIPVRESRRGGGWRQPP